MLLLHTSGKKLLRIDSALSRKAKDKKKKHASMPAHQQEEETKQAKDKTRQDKTLRSKPSLTGSCTYSAQIIATRTSTGIAANHKVPSTTSRPMKPLLTELCSASKVLTAPTRKTQSRTSLTRTKKYAGAESSECDLAWWSSLSLKGIYTATNICDVPAVAWGGVITKNGVPTRAMFPQLAVIHLSRRKQIGTILHMQNCTRYCSVVTNSKPAT